ncbi:uncharacterized protein LOC129237598 [Anastrepha obliqua]|uniref:uncharacterized protein LOC129237598 n=1 Tax=Anastrepha obliqua TaxID=95512 RepID=UPI00240A56B1|nr:uncharacterized protein LOC129237598 [Anastrepha obliqua]
MPLITYSEVIYSKLDSTSCHKLNVAFNNATRTALKFNCRKTDFLSPKYYFIWRSSQSTTPVSYTIDRNHLQRNINSNLTSAHISRPPVKSLIFLCCIFIGVNVNGCRNDSIHCRRLIYIDERAMSAAVAIKENKSTTRNTYKYVQQKLNNKTVKTTLMQEYWKRKTVRRGTQANATEGKVAVK